MFNGLSIHWIVLPALSNVCRASRGIYRRSYQGRTEVAVVYDHMRNELFTATRGQGRTTERLPSAP